jgi:hypothetical protein
VPCTPYVFSFSRGIIQAHLEVLDDVLYISFRTICHTVSKFANFIPIYPTSFFRLLFSGVHRNNSAHPIINARSKKATLLSHRFSIPLRLFYSFSVLFFSKHIPSQEFPFFELIENDVVTENLQDIILYTSGNS